MKELYDLINEFQYKFSKLTKHQKEQMDIDNPADEPNIYKLEDLEKAINNLNINFLNQ